MARAKVKKSKVLMDLVAARKSTGVNQSVFWGEFGVTQSAGSRYETGREIPTTTAMLITLKELGHINSENLLEARKMVEATIGLPD